MLLLQHERHQERLPAYAESASERAQQLGQKQRAPVGHRQGEQARVRAEQRQYSTLVF